MDFQGQIIKVNELQAVFRADVKRILASLDHVDPIIWENKTREFIDGLLLEMEKDGIAKESKKTLTDTRFEYLSNRMNDDNNVLAQIKVLIQAYKNERVRIANA